MKKKTRFGTANDSAPRRRACSERMALTGASTKATLKSAADETEPALLSPPSAPSCDFISTRHTGRRKSATSSRREASEASRRRWTERIEQTMRRDETCSVSLAPFRLSMWEEKRSDNKQYGGGGRLWWGTRPCPSNALPR